MNRYEDEDIGKGIANYTSDKDLLPILTILQPLSKACELGEHRPGDIYNGDLNLSYDGEKGIVIVPIQFKLGWTEWGTRAQGEGIQAVYPIDHEIFSFYKNLAGNERNTLRLKNFANGWELLKTIYIQALLVEPLPMGVYTLGFSVSKYVVADKWLRMLSNYRTESGQCPPIFAHLTRISTTKILRKSTNYYNINIQPACSSISSSLLDSDHDFYLQAKDLYYSINGKNQLLSEESEIENDDIPF